MKLIAGLGNPGKKYQKTRHNAGFMAVDFLHKNFSEYNPSPWSLSKKFNAEISEFNKAGEKIILAKPMTFMNASGHSIGLIANYYKIAPEDIIVLHDDKDIALGKYKIQNDRGDGGHNGIKSIVENLGTKEFTRIKIGVASSNEKKMTNTAKFVLNKFGLFEKKKLDEVMQKITEEIKKLI